jgi:hypothetical protein
MVSVVAVEPLDDYKLRVTLSNGRKGIFEMSSYLNRGVFQELKNKRYFQRVYVDYDTVVWPHGQDVAPETVEMLLQPEPSADKTPPIDIKINKLKAGKNRAYLIRAAIHHPEQTLYDV